MNIAVCDDERCELDNIRVLLNRYHYNKNIDMSVELFDNVDNLIRKSETSQYDILILDVLMPGITGIAAAQEIREVNKNVKIVFLTSSSEYAVDSYSVKASGYILKPITEDKLFFLLNDLLFEMETEQEKFLTIKTNNGLSRILLSKIEYCEIYNKTIYLHMTDKRVIEAFGSMNQLENNLCCFSQFYKSHRSYIINLNFVITVTADMVIMQSGGKVPVPYRKANEIKSVALSYFDVTSLGKGG